jgi:hypothetical protein
MECVSACGIARAAPVPQRHGFIVRLKVLQSLRIPAPLLHHAIGSHDGEQLRLAFVRQVAHCNVFNTSVSSKTRTRPAPR